MVMGNATTTGIWWSENGREGRDLNGTSIMMPDSSYASDMRRPAGVSIHGGG